MSDLPPNGIDLLHNGTDLPLDGKVGRSAWGRNGRSS